MPNNEKDTPTVIIMDQGEVQRRAAEERLRAQQAGEVKQLDKTQPGGVYKAPDGRFHDAHGREISEAGELASDKQYELPPAATAQLGGPEVTDAAREGTDPADVEWRSDMLEQRRESMKVPAPEGAPVFSDAILPAIEDEEDEVDESGTKTGRKVRKSARKRSSR